MRETNKDCEKIKSYNWYITVTKTIIKLIINKTKQKKTLVI